MDGGEGALRQAEVGAVERALGALSVHGSNRHVDLEEHGWNEDAGHDGMGEYGSRDDGFQEPMTRAMTPADLEAQAQAEAIFVQTISSEIMAALSGVIDASFIYKDMAGFAFRKLDGHFQNAGVERQEGLVGIILQEVYLNISALLSGHASSRYSEGYTHLEEPVRSQIDATVAACIKKLKLAIAIPFVSGKIKQPITDFSAKLADHHIPGTNPIVATVLENVWVAIKDKMETEARRSAPRTRVS